MSFAASRLLLILLAPALAWAGQSSSPAPVTQAPAPVVSGTPSVPPSQVPAPAAIEPAASAAPAVPGTVVVPVNTNIPLELRGALNSRTAYAGQAVYCDTIYPIVVRNRVVIPVGSYVKGRVTQVQRPGACEGQSPTWLAL